MKVLLDTHIFLWWCLENPKLSSKAQTIILNPNAEIYLSMASVWEMAIKISVGKLKLPGVDLEDFVSKELEADHIRILPISLPHLYYLPKLPLRHRDPFDRILIAQSVIEKIPLLTEDGKIKSYDQHVKL